MNFFLRLISSLSSGLEQILAQQAKALTNEYENIRDIDGETFASKNPSALDLAIATQIAKTGATSADQLTGSISIKI